MGWRKSVARSCPNGATGARSSGGTSTSSIRWPKKVALARSSTSRNSVIDWSGIASSFSRRWSRQGECTSSTGTPNTGFQSERWSQRVPSTSHEARRRPTTWSHVSIALSNGSIWAAVHGSRAVVTRTRGMLAPRTPASRAQFQPRPAIGTITLSTARSRAVISASSEAATSSERAGSPWQRTTTRTPAPALESRWKWASKGSSGSSDVDIRTPADAFEALDHKCKDQERSISFRQGTDCGSARIASRRRKENGPVRERRPH